MKESFNWLQLLNPEYYINFSVGGVKIGIYLVLFIIFAETGLFIGFFLPGDSLLFLSGIYSRDLMGTITHIDSDFLNVFLLASLVAIAGILGNMIGYWFGYKSGAFLFKKEDSLLFKKKYLFQAKDFYNEHGSLAIIFARFLPIFRTFSPIIAGIVKMNKGKFMLYNIVGSITWSFSLIFAGHYLQALLKTKFDFDLKEHIELIVVGIVLITTAPVIIKLFFNKTKS